MGLVTPDEPRYADIGRAMARSGDWIMPRLFGVPWYEKPALLYWMTGLGNLAGLGPEWAPRLPVSILSLTFLAFYWNQVRRKWNAEIANYAAAVLATSAGWLAYSHVGVTDLPLAVFFSAAVLLAADWIETGDRSKLPAVTACLALAVLAKGLVPLVLFVPVAAFGWRRFLDWVRPWPLLTFAAIALPWYVLCSVQSHGQFLTVFFLQHHFGRFQNNALQHAQPWWFYLPVLLLLLFPWFPFVVTIGLRSRLSTVLAATTLFGVVFFSASVNKLPGYVLPLLPLMAILLGQGIANARAWKLPLVISAGLVGILPLVGEVLPDALARGTRSAAIPWPLAAFVGVGILAGLVATRFSRATAISIVFAITGMACFWLEWTAFPRIDQAASARPIWNREHPVCVGKVSRSFAYGLQYYAGHALPDCTLLDQRKLRVVR